MADEIRQVVSVDTAQAIQNVKALDSAFKTFGGTIDQLASKMGGFNGSAFTKTANTGTASFNQLAQSGQQSLGQVRSLWEDLISCSGRYTTSVQLASRIGFTQGVLSSIRMVRTALDETVQSAMAFQKQLALIRSIDTDKVFGADLGKQLRDLSSSSGIALPEIGAGTYEALSAQVIRSSEDFRFLKSATDLARAGFASFDDSVKLLSGTLSAFGKDSSDADRLSSEFFETARLGNITVSELASQFGTVSTLANQVGLSTAEVNAAFVVLTNRGLNAANAATQIRGVLSGLIKPSEELTRVLRSMGFENVEQAVKALGGFGNLLKALTAQTDGSAESQGELFRNVRALAGQLQLGGQGAQLYADSLERLKGISADLAKEKAGEVMDTDAERLNKKWNQFTNDLIPFGNGLLTVGNKGLETLGVFRDLSVAILDTTGSIITLNPRLSEFGHTWESLQALFGKDLSIGEFGGKIVSEIEIRQRQLDLFKKRHEEDDAARLKQEAERDAELNKIRFKALDDFKSHNDKLQSEAQSAADRLIETERNKVSELSRQIQNLKNLVKESPTKIAGLQARQDRRDFDTRTEDLSGPQRALALSQLAADQARQAAEAMRTAARTGNKEDIDRARALFEAAQATGEESRNLAKSAGDRRGALFAARQLQELTREQVAAERQLSASARARIPTLEQEKAKAQERLDLITKATKELVQNSTLFKKNSDGSTEQLSPDELKKQAEARQRALATLQSQGVGADVIADLSFRTEGSLQQLGNDLRTTLSNIGFDDKPFHSAASATSNASGHATKLANEYERAARAAAFLGTQAPPSIPQAEAPQATLPNSAFGGLIRAYAEGGYVPDYFAPGGFAKGIDTVPAMLAPGEFVMNQQSTGRFFSTLQAFNAAGRDVHPVGDFSRTTNINVGGINVSGADKPEATGKAVFDHLNRLQRRGVGRIKQR